LHLKQVQVSNPQHTYLEIPGKASRAVCFVAQIASRNDKKNNMEPIEDSYCVYIMTNKHHTVLYTGVTSDLYNRVLEHRTKAYPGFTAKYNVYKLVYFEQFGDVNEAIAREKQIKGGSRKKKIDLINSQNLNWDDLWEREFKDLIEFDGNACKEVSWGFLEKHPGRCASPLNSSYESGSFTL
jgi:putative endonuclease